MATKKLTFETVTQWIDAGGMATGYYLFSEPVAITEKAVAFKAKKFNSYGNLFDCQVWFPLSKVQFVKNDYYVEGVQYYLIPAWLYEYKRLEGFDI